MEVMREHFDECLVHFFGLFRQKFPRGKRNRREKMKDLADFCGVSDQTIHGWINSQNCHIKGQNAIKLVCFLDLHEYRVIEFERMDKVIRSFVELIGFSILTIEDARERLGFSLTQNIYDAVWGRSGLSEEKKQIMWSLWKEHKEELEIRKEKIRSTSSFKALLEQPNQALLSPLSQVPVQQMSNQRMSAMCILSGLLLLLEDGLFENLSDEEVEKFTPADLQNIGRLSVHLSTLSSRLIQKR
jgi:hypothetical protein